MSLSPIRTKRKQLTKFRRRRTRISKRNALLCRVARDITSAVFDIPLTEIEKPTRAGEASCMARHSAMYLSNVVFQVPLAAIAREFGRDRSSVGYAVRRVEELRDDAAFDRRLERLESLASNCLTLAAEGCGT